MGASLHLNPLVIMYRPPTHGVAGRGIPVEARWYYFAAM
jgi:hypothetical protein